MEVSFSISSQSGMFNLSLFIVALHIQALAIDWATVPFHEVIVDFI
jgi:hypothetical protein